MSSSFTLIGRSPYSSSQLVKNSTTCPTKRIITLDLGNAANGVGATKRKERITAPRGPLFEATKRETRLDLIAPPPPPDRQRCSEELIALLLDGRTKVPVKSALLGILATSIKFDNQEAPCQVFGHRRRVAGHRQKSRTGDRDHFRVFPETADRARILSGNLCEQIRADNLSIDVVEKNDRIGGDKGGR